MQYFDGLRRTALVLGAALLAAAGQVAPAAQAAGGTLEQITVHGASLEGNLTGDSADRKVYVYLPPGYAQDTQRRYPVVYFLHGIILGADPYVQSLAWPASIDRAIAAGRLPPSIFVMPDALTLYGGSMYSNSPTIGDWEAFVARDLVTHIDAHYRTIPAREARGLSGHSMGGYGTLRIGMKYPDTFSSLYAMSSCCMDVRGVAPGDAQLEELKTREQLESIPMFGRLTLAVLAAWAPNVQKPPFYVDLPVEGGQPRADVLARYAANAPSVMVGQYGPQLKRYKAIAMDVGDKDFIASGNQETSDALTRVGVAHSFQIYDGDHVNKVSERFEQNVLPFFATHLETGAPAR